MSFSKGIFQTSGASFSEDEQRLNSILVSVNENETTFLVSDEGCTMTAIDTNFKFPIEMDGLLLPIVFCKELIKIISQIESGLYKDE